MIVRHFLTWVRTASAGERADATRALARAYLISNLSEDDRFAAEGALLKLLDDRSPLVLRAMAEVFCRSHEAPPAVIHALSADQPFVAAPILEFSPLLIDADLVDLCATSEGEAQVAIARRAALPVSVAAALAEVGGAESCLVLLKNGEATIPQFSLDRIVERHGADAGIRECLIAREDLPPTTRLMLVNQLSSQLSRFVVARNWLSFDRAERLACEAQERAIVNVAAQTRGASMAALVRHLRASGELNAGLVLRALLSANLGLFEQALVELTGVTHARVAGIVHDRGGASFVALLNRAGFPASTIPAFSAALSVVHEHGFADNFGGVARLRRAMVERVLTRLADENGPETDALFTLLRRYAAEAAREEARLFCDDLVAMAHDGHPEGLIAA